MIRKLILICATTLLVACATAQTSEGVQFKEDTFRSIQKASRRSGKLIFIDIYTTWCGPCKFLTSNIFPDKAVGDYMNQTFVNAKFDAEKGEGIELERQYAVEAYPTMLILDSRGRELGRLRGISRTPEMFLKRLQAEMERINSVQ